MDEQFVIHPYSEIPFRNKNNEQVIYATTCINLKGVNLSKKKKSVSKDYIFFASIHMAFQKRRN